MHRYVDTAWLKASNCQSCWRHCIGPSAIQRPFLLFSFYFIFLPRKPLNFFAIRRHYVSPLFLHLTHSNPNATMFTDSHSLISQQFASAAPAFFLLSMASFPSHQNAGVCTVERFGLKSTRAIHQSNIVLQQEIESMTASGSSDHWSCNLANDQWMSVVENRWKPVSGNRVSAWSTIMNTIIDTIMNSIMNTITNTIMNIIKYVLLVIFRFLDMAVRCRLAPFAVWPLIR